jgi:trk system potassium uptake protein
MQITAIQRIIGLLLILFSTTLLPPMVVDLIYQEGAGEPFLIAFAITLLAGILLWLPVRHIRRELRLRDGFLVVVLFWSVLGMIGALPLWLADVGLSITDAVFESVSGLTTTGATVIVGIDHLPHAILFYRQELQWLGGLGIIVLAVAVLPLLGIGGMQLYRAETPGPMKDNKLTPRITETAKALWYIYLALTLVCALLYWIAGMTPFNAIAHSFSTVAIGGFSTHDASMAYYAEKPLVEIVAIVFMFISGVNFALHFLAWRGRDLRGYLADEEFRTYATILFMVAVVTTLYLAWSSTFESWSAALLHGLFQTVSIGTTTGFTTSDYAAWPSFLPVLLLFTSFIGGCATSTGGGMKVVRFLLLIKQGIMDGGNPPEN